MRREKLGQICEVVSRVTPKTNVEEYRNGEFNWITPAEINDNDYIISDTKRKITQLAIEKKKLPLLPKGTVLLSSRAPIGKVAITGKEMYCNQGFKNLICSDEICNEYLYWYLKSKKEYLNSLGRGATFKEISKKIVENIEIKLPEIERQRKIVDKLKKVDKIIQRRKNQSRLLDVVVQARFVEMFGSVHDGRFEMKTLPEIVMKERNAIKRGPFGGSLKKQDFVEEGYLVYEQKHAIHEDFEYEKYYITKKKYEDMIAFKVIPGDLIVSCSGTLGRIAEVPNNAPEGIINQALLKLSLDQTIMKNKFFVYQFRNKEIQDILFGFSRGSGIPNMPSMNEIKKVKFLCPPIDLQNQFAIVVEQINKSKFVIHKFLYCTTHNTQSIIKPRPNTKESGKTRGGKPYADEF